MDRIPVFAGTMPRVSASAATSTAMVAVSRCRKPRFSPPAGCRLLAGLPWPEASPYVTDAPHTVRSMAILFKLPDGEEWRTGMNNIPVFAVKTAQGFHDQLVALAPDPATGKPDPAKMKAFLASYPETAKAIKLINAKPFFVSGNGVHQHWTEIHTT